jgi:hypothetical protein
MILVLTGTADRQADRVVERLERRGADVIRFDPAQFPSGAEVSLACSQAGPAGSVLRVGGRCLELDGLTSVWSRGPGLPGRGGAADECQAFLEDVWNGLDCLVVPGPEHAVRRALLPAWQLRVAAEVDCEVPPTLLTNSPADLLDFYRRHNGKVGGRRGGALSARTGEVVLGSEADCAEAVAHGPVLFQADVPRCAELRIIIVGRRVFAAEAGTSSVPHDLPAEVARRCVEFIARLGLCYGAIDMVLTPDDRYVFLGADPAGDFLGIEEQTGLPITDALCGMLLSGNPRNDAPRHPVGALGGGAR